MWYSCLMTPPPRIVISTAVAPLVIDEVDPSAHQLFGSPSAESSAHPLSVYSPTNDAVYLNDSGYNTYLQHAFPNESPLSRGMEGGAMLPSRSYDAVRRNLDKSIGSVGLSSEERKPLGDIYDTVVNRAMPANPVGVITLRYPAVSKSGDTAESTLSRNLSHEHIHRVQNELGGGDVHKHLNQDELAYLRHRRPFYHDLYQSLRRRGYGADPAEIVSEGAAFVSSEGGSSALDPYGNLSQDERLRRSTIWISNYLNHIIEQHGPQAARAMFSRSHSDIRTQVERLINVAEQGSAPQWLNKDAKF